MVTIGRHINKFFAKRKKKLTSSSAQEKTVICQRDNLQNEINNDLYEEPKTPRILDIDCTAPRLPLGRGSYGKVQSTCLTNGDPVALKIQRSNLFSKKEYVFAKIFEAAETQGKIPTDIHFVHVKKDAFSEKTFKYNGKNAYVFTMEQMDGKLETYFHNNIFGQSKIINMLNKQIKKLETIGFILCDMNEDNVMYQGKRFNFGDFGQSYIREGSEAHKIAKEFIDKIENSDEKKQFNACLDIIVKPSKECRSYPLEKPDYLIRRIFNKLTGRKNAGREYWSSSDPRLNT